MVSSVDRNPLSLGFSSAGVEFLGRNGEKNPVIERAEAIRNEPTPSEVVSSSVQSRAEVSSESDRQRAASGFSVEGLEGLASGAFGPLFQLSERDRQRAASGFSVEGLEGLASPGVFNPLLQFAVSPARSESQPNQLEKRENETRFQAESSSPNEILSTPDPREPPESLNPNDPHGAAALDQNRLSTESQIRSSRSGPPEDLVQQRVRNNDLGRTRTSGASPQQNEPKDASAVTDRIVQLQRQPYTPNNPIQPNSDRSGAQAVKQEVTSRDSLSNPTISFGPNDRAGTVAVEERTQDGLISRPIPNTSFENKGFDPRQSADSPRGINTVTDNDLADSQPLSNQNLVRKSPDPRRSNNDSIRVETLQPNNENQLVRHNPDPRSAGSAGLVAEAAKNPTAESVQGNHPGLRPQLVFNPAALSSTQETTRHVIPELATQVEKIKDDSGRGIRTEHKVENNSRGNLIQQALQRLEGGDLPISQGTSQDGTQQAINRNSTPRAQTIGSFGETIAGQNSVAQQIRLNTDLNPVGTSPRTNLARQNAIEETVRQNNTDTRVIPELSGIESARKNNLRQQVEQELQSNGQRERQPGQEIEENARALFNQLSQERGSNVQELLNQQSTQLRSNQAQIPKQDINTAIERTEDLRERKDFNPQNPLESQINPAQSAIDVPRQDIGTITPTSPNTQNPPTPGLRGNIVEQAELAAIERVERQQATQEQLSNIRNAQQDIEAQNREDRNLDPVTAQTQIGRNIDRLI